MILEASCAAQHVRYKFKKNPTKHPVRSRAAVRYPALSFAKRPQHRIFQFRPLIELRAREPLVYSGIYSSILRTTCIALPAYCTREIKTAMYYPSRIESGFGVRNLQSRERISRFERSRYLPSTRRCVIYGPCNVNRKFILETVQRSWFVFDRINISRTFYSESYSANFSSQ